MRTNSLLLLLLSITIMTGLWSCIPQKQVSSSKQELSAINKQLEGNSVTLKELDTRRKGKESTNQIDDTANARIKKFIDRTQLEIDTLVKENSILIGETVVDKNDWNRLKAVLSATRGSSKRINDKIMFLNDLINRNMVVKLEQDVLFEAGKYSVEPSVVQSISKFFEPAAKEIDLFTRKYPDFPLSLVITARGYADGTTIGEGSQLYRDLKERLSMSSKEPDSKELNKELSKARAEEVKKLFQKFANSRQDNQIFLSKVLYLHQGMGESLPDPNVTDYKVSDPRRRVVLLFWSVFPD